MTLVYILLPVITGFLWYICLNVEKILDLLRIIESRTRKE